jgi:hypothetical protein
MERAQKDPHRKMLALAHHIDQEALNRAFNRVRKKAAVPPNHAKLASGRRARALSGRDSYPQGSFVRFLYSTMSLHPPHPGFAWRTELKPTVMMPFGQALWLEAWGHEMGCDSLSSLNYSSAAKISKSAWPIWS